MSLLTTPEAMFLYCPTCSRETLTEAPPCPDGHGESCPDRACLECGTALTNAPITDLVRSAVASAHTPRRTRHAA